jgi:DNA repair photolyase
MSRRTVFIPYRPKSILNKGKRADHWFWTRYSAYPYIGCQHGCEFCYCREQKFCPYDDLLDFPYVIKVKENAADLLRRQLSKTPVDMVFTGDYQPAERLFKISRKLLEVCYDLGFPVFVLERSPLILRDLDLLQAIHTRARTVTAFSIIYTPESPHADRIRTMEHLAPPPEKRFAAMQKLASAGIPTGTSLMPILPVLCDSKANLESVIRWTADHGGQFVLAASLTLADQQRRYFFEFLSNRFPDLLQRYQSIYPVGAYSPSGDSWRRIALDVHELCQKYGIRDRIPRPIIPGERRSFNKQIVEHLAERVHLMELEGAPPNQVWPIRKASWAVEDLEQDIRLVYNRMGLKGLQSIQNLDTSISKELEILIIQSGKLISDKAS